MNKTKIAKFVTSVVAGAGTSHIVDGIVKSNVQFDDLNSFGKFQVAVARVVIGSMAAHKTKEFTDARIDNLVTSWQTAQSEATETTTEV